MVQICCNIGIFVKILLLWQRFKALLSFANKIEKNLSMDA
jgi:hypothetical protein